MSDPIKTVYFHGPQVSLGGDTEKAVRFSQLTYAPGDRWEMSQWNYRGCIAIYVLEGDEFTLDHIDLTGGGSAFKGAPTNSAPGTAIDSHTWSPLGSSTNNVVLEKGEAIAFLDNVFHNLENTGQLPATVLVVSAIDDDECGATTCFLHP